VIARASKVHGEETPAQAGAMCFSLTFIILADHMLVFKMYWKMAYHATCLSLCVCLVTIYISVLSQKNSGCQETQFGFSLSPRLMNCD
jgi:hypothetical protein